MTGLYVPDATGQFVKVTKGLWAADASGTFQPVKNGWVSDAGGTYRKIWPYSVGISSFKGAKGATGYPAYAAMTLSWTVANSDHVEVRLAGSSTVLYTGTASSMIFTGTPGVSYTFNLRAVAADGSYFDSQPVTVTLDPLPAPGNFAMTARAATTAGWAWNAVNKATSYEVVDTLAANAVKGSVNAPTVNWNEGGLTAYTTYERAVRAKLSTATSPVSNKIRFTTPGPVATPAGTYDFPATYAETWSSNLGWRGPNFGTTHGDGDNWGGNAGVNTTVFLYDDNALRALSGRVTRFKIRMKRDAISGNSAPQGNRFYVHTMAARSAGSPIPYLGGYSDIGSLSWGQEALFDLPVSWGQYLIDNTYGVNGIAWGNVLLRYMRGPGLATYPDAGHLYITIG